MFQKISDFFCKTKTEKKYAKRLLIILAVVFVMAIIFVGTAIAYESKYKDRIYPGVRVGDLNLGGLTPEEAFDLLSQITAKIEEDGIAVSYQQDDKLNFKITPSFNALNDPDLSRRIIYFDNQKTIGNAFAIGRGNGSWNNFMTKLTMLLNDKQMKAEVILNRDELKTLLEDYFLPTETPPKNAKPQVRIVGNTIKIEILPEQDGVVLNYDPVVVIAEHNLSQLKNPEISVTKSYREAEITMAEVWNKKDEIRQVLTTTTPEFVYEKKSWTMSQADLASMIEFQTSTTSPVVIGLNFERFKEWAEKKISPTVAVKPKDAIVEIKDGRIVRFAAHRNGQEINFDKTYYLANRLEGKPVELAINIVEPEKVIGDLNDLGVQEIIGRGESNFAGSPYNRRHNIKVGAQMLNGIVIKPGEEFHLVEKLSPIDDTSGYLTELVIKGNKTVPEYGGGLCQIGTTVFRAALDSGLKITERKSHAYSVPYYLLDGKPGMDATIYDPRPDVRFVNDTGNNILIQAHIDGSDLIFEFWGTRDGRQVEISEIRNWGWIKPEETKYVETLDLDPGKQKCTESAHWGVSAAFDYKVTVNGEVKEEETFHSKYKPWQEVCLIGVEELSGNATSTEE